MNLNPSQHVGHCMPILRAAEFVVFIYNVIYKRLYISHVQNRYLLADRTLKKAHNMDEAASDRQAIYVGTCNLCRRSCEYAAA
jgi:hypothetical protein